MGGRYDSNGLHYASAADGGEGIQAPSPQHQEVMLEAWHQALGQILSRRDNEWRQQLRAVKAESMAAIAEMRANAAEIRGTMEAMIEKRLARIRQPADGSRGVPGVEPMQTSRRGARPRLLPSPSGCSPEDRH